MFQSGFEKVFIDLKSNENASDQWLFLEPMVKLMIWEQAGPLMLASVGGCVLLPLQTTSVAPFHSLCTTGRV